MRIKIKSYIKETVKIEVFQCKEKLMEIEVDKGATHISNIHLVENGTTEIVVNVSEKNEDQKNALYYLLGGEIRNPIESEFSDLIGTKIYGEFQENMILNMSCVGSEQSKHYCIIVEDNDALEISYYLKIEKEELVKRIKKWKNQILFFYLIGILIFIHGILYGIINNQLIISGICSLVIAFLSRILYMQFKEVEKKIECMYRQVKTE